MLSDVATEGPKRQYYASAEHGMCPKAKSIKRMEWKERVGAEASQEHGAVLDAKNRSGHESREAVDVVWKQRSV